MADISDQELANLRAAHTMLDKMYRKDRRGTQRLMKAAEPQVTIDEDVAQPYIEELGALRKEFKEFVDTQKNERIDARLNDEFNALRKDGWTDDGLEKLKKFQIDRNIPSPLDAAAVWDRVNPPPKAQLPSSFSPTSWNLGASGGDDNLKLLWSDEDRWAEQEAQKAWDEAAAG